MTETVSTGGVMQFQYNKNQTNTLPLEQKREIEKGYEEYYKRKENEKRRKKILFGILILLILLIIGLIIYRRFF